MTHQITLAEIESRVPHCDARDWTVMGENDAHYRVVARVGGEVYARGARHNNLVRVVRTGRKVSRDNLVRVRIEFARDLGDAAGTLCFGDADHASGRADFRLFPEED